MVRLSHSKHFLIDVHLFDYDQHDGRKQWDRKPATTEKCLISRVETTFAPLDIHVGALVVAIVNLEQGHQLRHINSKRQGGFNMSGSLADLGDGDRSDNAVLTEPWRERRKTEHKNDGVPEMMTATK